MSAKRAAQRLIDARRSGQRLAALPEGDCPRTFAEAYAVQDEVLASIGAIGGWKVGARSETAEPTCAPLPGQLVFDAPIRFTHGAFALNGVEAELAFTLARDLPPRGEPYSEGDVAAVISALHPAIEVVDSRFAEIAAVDPLSILADMQSNGALVVGRGVAMPVPLRYEEQRVELWIDGASVVDARGGNPAGNPLRLLAWLANHVAQRCGGLRAGQVVTTGSWTGMRFVAEGALVVARFPGVGEVEVGL